MDDGIKMRLYDILSAIQEIENFFSDRPKQFESYCDDLRTKRAVERNIEIIGEATNRILQQDGSIDIRNSRKIIDARNRVIHGYDSISDETVWGIVINYLPELKMEVEKLLDEPGLYDIRQ
jgi:uncharacterized protein with HEPN domain